LEILDKLLEGKEYLAGSQRTLADISMRCTLCTSEVLSIDLAKFPNSSKWLERVKKVLPFEEINTKGMQSLSLFLQSLKHTS
jgi:glutathione S-transferase